MSRKGSLSTEQQQQAPNHEKSKNLQQNEVDLRTDNPDEVEIATGNRKRGKPRREGREVATVTGGAPSSKARKNQPSPVLLCEYSKEVSLQSTLRVVVDMLNPMVGFLTRVTERGGTKLGSLLSTKNLWSGEECGRKECRVYEKPGERREDCIRRNILYESDDKLELTGVRAALYVG